MPKVRQAENSDEEYEILDLVENNLSTFDTTMKKIFGDVTKASAAKQLLIGGGTGWLSGFLFVKVGKAAAISIGATALAFQVAQYNGLITVNWTKVNRLVHDAQRKARKHLEKTSPSYYQRAKDFYHENVFLTVGFSAGFFTGVFF